ncbi:MAG: TRAP transporter small permease [Spirochaetales bacterium]|nr:TRAP transporter small permease [Spirochaetales bacterium]
MSITKDSGELKPSLLSSVPLVAGIEKVIVRIVQAVIGVLLALMVAVVFSNVVARYLLNSALAWSEEISRFMLIWLAFLGAVIAYIKGEHLGLDVMVKILPPKGAALLQFLANCLVLYAVFVIFTGGLDLTMNSLSSGWTSPAANVSYGLVYSIVPVSLILFFYFSVVKLIDSLILLLASLKGGNKC